MFRRSADRRARFAPWVSALLVALAGAGASGCAEVDYKAALQMSDLSSGFYDAGVTDLGLNKLVPSVTFSLKNVSAEPVTSIDLVVFFWAEGREGEEDQELDEIIVTAIGSEGLAPGAATEAIVVRSKQGYTLEQARAELFTHPRFRDVTAKVFLKRGGRIMPFGEYTIDRRLLLAVPTESTSR